MNSELIGILSNNIEKRCDMIANELEITLHKNHMSMLFYYD